MPVKTYPESVTDYPDWTTATASLGGSSFEDWSLSPKSGTSITRLFDDCMGGANRNLKASSPFYSLGTSSAYWDEAYDYPEDATGIFRATTTTSAYARALLLGPTIYNTTPTDGNEWMFEMRVKPVLHGSASNTTIAIGSFSPKADINSQTTEQMNGYSDTAKSGIFWKPSETYWRTFTYDNEGTNGGTTEANTSAVGSNSTWVRLGIHCKRETMFSIIQTWRTDCYINGTKVGSSLYNASGTQSPTFGFHLYNSGDSLASDCLVDWISLQYRRPNAVTYLDIEDLT